MKQPEQWSRYAERILATGARPHFAPEPETIDVHSRVIAAWRASHGAAPRALVLGATPELADLALDLGCPAIRMDCNPAMFDAAAKRQRRADRHGEQIVVGDWLDMPGIDDGAIDLVLGDMSLNNVTHAQMPRLFGQLRRITRAGSVLSVRQLALPPDVSQTHALARTVGRLRTGEIAPHTFRRLLRYATFLDAVYDCEQRLLDARRVHDCIDAAARDGRLGADEHAFMNAHRSEIQHTVYPWSEQQAWFARLGATTVERGGPACDHEFLYNVWVTQRT
jgi:hypothetical protein